MDHREEFSRTIVYGETAVGHLKANVTPAYPRNYELWYTYAAGFNQSLNKAVNELLRANGVLTIADTDKVYEEFLSPMRFGDRVEHIGGKLSAELRGVVGAIDQARASASDYGHALEDASSNLVRSGSDQKALRQIVDGLVSETRSMELRNQELERHLLESKRQIDELQISLEAIRNEALIDPLTNLANRKCFDQSLARCFAEAESSGRPFSLLMSDIDHFKKFNDTYGHQTGDQVLRLVANAVKQNVKGQDVAARYGGEEFAIILPRTALDQSARVAEHIRDTVMSKELVKRSTGERLGRVTISLGCACWQRGDTAQTLIERADASLYRAKHLGRNRVCTERDLQNAEPKAVA